MAYQSKEDGPQFLRQIQVITSDCSDGVIMIDGSQHIRWANSAALRMHGVHTRAELGRTIDEYHAIFRVRFCGAQSRASDKSVDAVASGETFRDVIIEVTPLHSSKPEWSYRARNLVLVDECENPVCVVLMLRELDAPKLQTDRFLAAVADLPHAAAIIRVDDLKIIQANADFLAMSGVDVASFAATGIKGSTLFHDAEDALRAIAAGEASRELRLSSTMKTSRDGGAATVLAMPVTSDNQRCVLVNVLQNTPLPIPSAASDGNRDVASFCRSAPSLLFALNADMEICAASPALVNWLSYGESSMLGRKATEFMTSSSAAHFEGHAWPALFCDPLKHDLTVDFATKTGAILAASLSMKVVPAEGGRPQVVLAAIIDITQQKLGEESLACMFSLSPVPMLIRKLEDSRVLDANDAFLALTELSAPDVVGHSVDELGLFESRLSRQQLEAGARLDLGVRNLEGRLKTRRGEMLDCLVSARRLQAYGQACILMTLQDISVRRRDEAQLFQAIENVMKESSWFSRSVIEKLAALRTPPKSGARSAAFCDLTPREREVLGLISNGLTDVEIGQTLGLTRSTVRNHVATLYGKIDVHSRSSAIIWARERGINIAWPATASTNLMNGKVSLTEGFGAPLVAKTRRA